MVILFVLIVVGLSVVHMTPPDAGPRVTGEKIKLDDILGNKFKPNSLNATWNQGERINLILLSSWIELLYAG